MKLLIKDGKRPPRDVFVLPLDFSFDEEQELFRKIVREFAQKEIAPKLRDYDVKGEYPWEIHEKMAHAGLLGINIPKEYGGQGADSVTTAIACEEMGRVGWHIPLSDILAETILRYGTDEQKDKWVRSVAKGETMLGIGSTEPGTGSDAGGIKTHATKHDGEYIINGEKSFITAVREAAAFLLMTRTSDAPGSHGVSMILVEMDNPGIQKTYFKTLGWRTTSFGAFSLRDVHVPVSNLLGEENKGFRCLMQTFDFMRSLIGIWCVGMAQAALERCIEYVKQRKAFGRPLAKFEAVQFRIAEDATFLEAARLLCYKVFWLKDKGLPYTRESAMTKWWAPEVAYRVVDNALQSYGALGFTTDSEEEWHLRDIRGALISDGTPDIMKTIMGREILGREFIPYRD